MFLPLHFLTLGLALRQDAALDGFLRWTDNPLLKVTEALLVILLTVHLTGGLRLLALEFLPWREEQKVFISVGFGAAVLAGLLFLFNV